MRRGRRRGRCRLIGIELGQIGLHLCKAHDLPPVLNIFVNTGEQALPLLPCWCSCCELLAKSIKTIATNLLPALEIYADILRRPHLPDDELDACRALALQDLHGLEDEPATPALGPAGQGHCKVTRWSL